ncbi:ferredoxin [Saccharothrix sp. ST-888]|uniref:ferredoxin n=1 Tax=Saccharothrix sp. ST-888 TaxID=1427391 RepID=UPI0026B39D61
MVIGVRVDAERCCGSGNCAFTLPEVFDQDPSDGRVVLLQNRPHSGVLDLVREAADLCPSGAIELTE